MIALALLYLTVGAQGGGWKMVGQIGGPTQGIAVQGMTVYAGIGRRLIVLDASSPSDLREIGATLPFPQAVEDVVVSGSMAYVAAGTAGLRIVDVADGRLPVEVGSWDSRGYAHAVAVAGSTVYVADGAFGLRLIDASNPAHPVEVGSAYSTNYALDVVTQGRYAYVAGAGAGLLIANVADPTHPAEAGALVTDYAFGVAVAEGIAFVANGWEGIATVSITDPAHPVLLATHTTPGWAVGVTVAGPSLYVADSFRGVRVLDVSDPYHPRDVASSESAGGHAGSVAVSATKAFVADRNRGVRAVDLATGPALSDSGSFHPPVAVDGVTISGQYAYIAESNTGLFVIDVSDPARPRQVGRCDIEGNALDVMVRSSLAYLTTKGPGFAALHIIDVSQPSTPVRLSTFRFANGQPRGLDLAGEHAYVPIENGLEILNVTDPRVPVRSSYLLTKDHESGFKTSVGVTVAGTMACLSLEEGGLATVDVSNPANPIVKATFAPGVSSLIRDAAVSGNYAYVGDSRFGLRVLDLSDPVHPIEVASLRTPGPQTVAMVGSSIYLAGGENGLVAVDVSSPTRPRLTGTHLTTGYARDLAAAAGKTFLADGPGGLLILEWQPETSVTDDSALSVNRAFLLPASAPTPQAAALASTSAPVAARAAAAPAACVVTSVSDSGPGTLRQCLQDGGPGSTITFDPAIFPPTAPAPIRLASQLPDLHGVTLDGSDAGVILDGTGATPTAAGNVVFGLYSRTDGNVVRGLQILGFRGNGIQFQSSRNVIGGDRSKGRGPTGQGNVISANRDAGIMISGDGGATASENVIIGNFIGTGAEGTKPLGNGMAGVWLQRTTSNRVGGTDPADRNLVSANGLDGILVAGQSTQNVIAGNYCGTDVTGTLPLGNKWCGANITMGAFGNTLTGNLLSGNDLCGLKIDDAGSNYNSITANRIGTDAGGRKAVANKGLGIAIYEAPAWNRIGGTRPEDRNIISGNTGFGIGIQSPGNFILGNFVGVDITGRNPLGNSDSGVGISRSPNMLGGATPREANVIGDNLRTGVSVNGSYSTVLGNFIGTDSEGVIDLGNHGSGITMGGIDGIVQGNVIAHSSPSSSFGAGNGIALSADVNCTIRRNSIRDNAASGIETTGVPGAPVITTATLDRVAGMACGLCEVEIFSDSDGEGWFFEGTTLANEGGSFDFTGSFLRGPNVTATATDRQGRTSRFSEPMRTPPKPPRRRAARH